MVIAIRRTNRVIPLSNSGKCCIHLDTTQERDGGTDVGDYGARLLRCRECVALGTFFSSTRVIVPNLVILGQTMLKQYCAFCGLVKDVVKEINPNSSNKCNIGYDYNFFCAESWPRTYT